MQRRQIAKAKSAFSLVADFSFYISHLIQRSKLKFELLTEVPNLKSRCNKRRTRPGIVLMLLAVFGMANLAYSLEFPGVDANIEYATDDVRKALDEIRIKQSAIKELVANGTRIFLENGNIKETVSTKIWERQPGCLRMENKLAHADLGEQNITNIIDGKTEWDTFAQSPEMIKKQADKWKRDKLPQTKINEMIAESSLPRRYKIDLNALRRSGVLDRYLMEKIIYRHPLIIERPMRIKISKSTATEWTFECNSRNERNAKYTAIYVYSKLNGLCVRKDMSFANGNQRRITLDSVRINPSQPIDNRLFQSPMPVNGIMDDWTSATIRGLMRRKPKPTR